MIAAFFKPTAVDGPTSVALVEYVYPTNIAVAARSAQVARITADGSYALIKGNTRSSYKLAVLAPEVELPEGYGNRNDWPVYREVGRYFHQTTIAETVLDAGEYVAKLAGKSPFVVELPGEAASRVEQTVAARLRIRDSRGQLTHPRYDDPSRAYEVAVRSLVADYGVDSDRVRVLERALQGAAEQAEKGAQTYVNAGWSITYTSPIPSFQQTVSDAHDEAIAYVVGSRVERAEWQATLEAKLPELEEELQEKLAGRVLAARASLAAAEELEKLGRHSVYDAAERVLQGTRIRFPGYDSRSAENVAQELAETAHQLEAMADAPVPNTVLPVDSFPAPPLIPAN